MGSLPITISANFILILFVSFILLSGCVQEASLENKSQLPENTNTLENSIIEKDAETAESESFIVELTLPGELTAQKDDFIKADFKITLEDGTLVNSSTDQNAHSFGKPLKFILGRGEILKGVEDAIIGLKLGQEVKIVLPSSDAFGNFDENKLAIISQKTLEQQGVNVQVGAIITANNFPAVIRDIKDGNVLLDFNHPLAGRKINFWVKILQIVR